MKKLVLFACCLVLFALPLSAQETASGDEKSTQKAGGVKSLAERIQRLEEAIGRDTESDKWYDRIQISGLIEVEAGYRKFEEKNDPAADTKESDVDLATVELVADAKIAKHVDGHVMFKYEEDEVFVDEGFIALVGTKSFPAYLIAGRQYLPFGYYDSHFVTDPNTLVLGETNQGAAVAGYRIGGERVDLSVGAFKGEIDKAGDDDAIDSFVAAITAHPLDFLMAGVSYTSNLASSDSLSAVIEENGTTELTDRVGGWSAFLTIEYLDRFKLIGEYVGALDDFEAGELYSPATLDKKRSPTAFNVELGAMIIEDLGLALRYGGSDDGAGVLPEKQYGAVLNWGIGSCNLAFEYLHDEFEDTGLDVEQEADTLTAQLAVAF
ncbi:LbtU family siderophore porin [Desulfosarcina sp.]|uniref:LbtU family siderophore porin n=1 Tax=Desulfosarcina sp. TaxID=2027861 RepID=UPI003568BF37